MSELTIPEFKCRKDYKEETKSFLSKIKCVGEVERRNAIINLLVKFYDDLRDNVSNAEQPGSETGTINDDAIEGILAIADTCIKEDTNLEKDLIAILQDKENNIKARVNAFYSLCTKYRRLKDFIHFRELVHGADGEVREDVIYNIMYAYFLIQETADDFDPNKALNYWNKMIPSIYKRLPAFTQIYTETVVLQCENTDKKDTPLLDEAENLINDAIKMRKYPKFYSTLGRIFCCMGKFDDGIVEVRRAIEFEESDRKDYMSRISEYQYIISCIQRKKDEAKMKAQAEVIQAQMKDQAEKIQRELEKSKTDYASILGFISGIMALIIGTIDVSRHQMSLKDSLPLLMGIAGMIIVSFGSMNLMLVRRDEKRDNKYSDWTLIMIGGSVFVLSVIGRLLYNYLKTGKLI
ncbi:MAG: hypothetical protein IJ914_10750 [Prevotella sp.]|nr:hypothetical protein [Prevotella sp.]